MFNITFNNISVISWQSVLLMEDTGVPGENQRPAASHRQTLSHNVVQSTPRMSGIRTHKALITQVVINPTNKRSRPRWSLRFIDIHSCIFNVSLKAATTAMNTNTIYLTHISYFPEKRVLIFNLKVFRKKTNTDTVEQGEIKSQTPRRVQDRKYRDSVCFLSEDF